MSALEMKILFAQFAIVFCFDFLPLILLTKLIMRGEAKFSLFSNINWQISKSLRAKINLLVPQHQLRELVKLSGFKSSESSRNTEGNIDSLKKRVEQEAMVLVKKYEQDKGRTIEDVSMYYTGFDLKSCFENKFIAIEVKGKSTRGDIFITANEWSVSRELKEKYFLYIVENIASGKPRLKIIQDPFNQVEAKVNKIQFIVSRKDYLSLATDIVDFN